MIKITLAKIAKNSPCADGFAKILFARGKITAEERDEFISCEEVPYKYYGGADDEEFPLVDAIESNGLEGTLWALRCLPEHDGLWRKFAVWCARSVQHMTDDQRCINALDVAWRHSDGSASDEDLAAARAAALDAAWSAARAAARAAALDDQESKLRQILTAGHWVD